MNGPWSVVVFLLKQLDRIAYTFWKIRACPIEVPCEYVHLVTETHAKIVCQDIAAVMLLFGKIMINVNGGKVPENLIGSREPMTNGCIRVVVIAVIDRNIC